MHRHLRRRVRLGVGTTPPFDVPRGLAQGAVESPWMYACFVDGLVRELRRRGFGVFFGERQIPCLLYADDIVLLAPSIPELHAMAEVAAEFARTFAFSFNGDKCGVMAFVHGKHNSPVFERAQNQLWRLNHEIIPFVSTYKYLGLDFGLQRGWHTYFRRAMSHAKQRSAELAWLCRGLSPRSAATLWKALVRPILEYGAEIWAGDLLTKEAEAIQTSFARNILRLPPGSPNLFVRSELGLERLSTRWSKLRMGYWRKIWSAPPSRALRYVASRRRLDLLAGRRSDWMASSRRFLTLTGLGEYWAHPSHAALLGRLAWKDLVHSAVNRTEMTHISLALAGLPSLSRYAAVKHWGITGSAYAAFSGEVCRLGAWVPERYLDDFSWTEETRLKSLCRANRLPLMDRVAKEHSWPLAVMGCLHCRSGVAEDLPHFVFDCPLFAGPRKALWHSITPRIHARLGEAAPALSSRHSTLLTLLGARTGFPELDQWIDRCFKRFLKKCWRLRRPITTIVNNTLNRKD